MHSNPATIYCPLHHDCPLDSVGDCPQCDAESFNRREAEKHGLTYVADPRYRDFQEV